VENGGSASSRCYVRSQPKGPGAERVSRSYTCMTASSPNRMVVAGRRVAHINVMSEHNRTSQSRHDTNEKETKRKSTKWSNRHCDTILSWLCISDSIGHVTVATLMFMSGSILTFTVCPKSLRAIGSRRMSLHCAHHSFMAIMIIIIIIVILLVFVRLHQVLPISAVSILNVYSGRSLIIHMCSNAHSTR